MLNHLIMLGNVFPVPVLTRILFLKIPIEYWSALKTFLIFLKYMPDTIEQINGKIITLLMETQTEMANFKYAKGNIPFCYLLSLLK